LGDAHKSKAPLVGPAALQRGYVTGGQTGWFKRICKQLSEIATRKLFEPDSGRP